MGIRKKMKIETMYGEREGSIENSQWTTDTKLDEQSPHNTRRNTKGGSGNLSELRDSEAFQKADPVV